MKIAIVAGARAPELSQSNAQLRDSLLSLEVEVPLLLWNRESAEAFLDCDLVVLRQTWDYQDDPSGFASWLVRLEALGGRVEVPGRLAIWNNDKRTLLELPSFGVNVPTTVDLTRQGADGALAQIQSDQVVLKPAFGGGGIGVRLCDRSALTEELQAARQIVPGHPYMVQQFLPQIADGEWKMTCVDGKVEIAIGAIPSGDEFRINVKFNPSVEVTAPPPAAREAAERIMAALGAPLCGRVDGIMVDGAFVVTELELTDPDLNLNLHHQPDVTNILARATT